MSRRTRWITGFLLVGASVVAFGQFSIAQDATPPTFAALVAGRSALCDGANALAASPRLVITAQFSQLDQSEDGKTTSRSGTERLLLDRATHHLSLSETDTGGTASLRYICDGRTLLGVTADHTYFRLPLNGNERTPEDALILVGARKQPLSAAAQMAFWTTDITPIPTDLYKAPDGSVVLAMPSYDQDGWRVATVFRFRYDAAMRPIRSERWETRTRGNVPGARTSYRTDDYAYTPLPTTASFSVAPPAGFREVAPPAGESLPPKQGPDHADPKALALLTRWQRAWTRFTSYEALIHIKEGKQLKTPQSPPDDGSSNREADMQVYYQRPGKLFVFSQPSATPNNAFNTYQTLISDGKNYALFYGKKREDKRGERATENDTTLSYRARDIGLHDFSEALPRILTRPQQIWEVASEAKYRGFLPLPGGGTAEAVTITQFFTNDNVWHPGDPGSPNRRQLLTAYFDAKTGLIVRDEYRNDYLVAEGTALLRDLPPDEYRYSDFLNIAVNKEPPRNVFSLTGH